jgi:hypothetical protein
MKIAVSFCLLDLSKDDRLTWVSATTIFLPGSQQQRSSYLDLSNDDLLTWIFATTIFLPGSLQRRSAWPPGRSAHRPSRDSGTSAHAPACTRNKTFLKSQESEIFLQNLVLSRFDTRGPGCGNECP